MKTVQLDFSEDFLRRLDQVAEARAIKSRPPSKFEWLQRAPEGKELWRQITLDRQHEKLQDWELNSLIDRRYRAATGGLKPGRPQLARFRAEVLEEAFQALFSPQLVRGGKR